MVDAKIHSSSFRVGQDKRWDPSMDKELYKSTIKQDYPAYSVTKQCRVPSPSPASIVPTEPRINEHTSITSSHFVKKKAKLVTVANMARFLRKTNFKMDADKKTTSFHTTHNEYFPVRAIDKSRDGKGDRMKSYIPQGDKKKANLPLSNYKDNYQKRDISKVNTAMPVHSSFVSTPILQGDPRTYEDQFETTSGRSFAVQLTMPQKLQPIKNNLSSICHGDPDKCAYSVTTKQKFYHGIPNPEKTNPCGPDYSTSVVLGDEKSSRPLCDYRTTATDSFPVISQTAQSQLANLNMGKSSLPEGDCDPGRSYQRITQTTNNYFFKKPVVSYPVNIVNGSSLRTKSDVDFGADKAHQSYNTTMKANFPAKFQSLRKIGAISAKSSVPLDYYGDQTNQSTTFTDFSSHSGIKRLLPNPKAIDNLIKSHIQSPTASTCEFITTHNASYPPKQIQKVTYEFGKLQKSSIPLGNLSVY